TGGDGVGYFLPAMYGPSNLTFFFMNIFEFSVFDVFSEWIDFDEVVDPGRGKLLTRNRIFIWTVHSNKAALDVFKFDMSARWQLKINIFLQTRNGGGSQQVRVARANGVIKIAIKTEIGSLKEMKIPSDFPVYDPNKPDLVFSS